MKQRRRDGGMETGLRRLSAGLGCAVLLTLFSAGPAAAQLLPADFFAAIPAPGSPAEVEANSLAYDSRTDVITAEGRVLMNYDGYQLSCDDLRYEQGSGDLVCIGNARVVDPDGNVFTADRMELTGGMKIAVIEALSVTTRDGALITARNVNFSMELETVLTEASYAPCGLCIDEKGNRIGWKVRAARIVQDPVIKAVTLEKPQLEVLGVPVAWLPWLSLPDPTQSRSSGFRLPGVDYKSDLGLVVRAPYFVAIGDDTDLLLTPQLMSRQGFLMAAEWEQRFDYGVFNLAASGLYQLDRSAFAGEVGDRDWRGAIQSSARFQVIDTWTAGWSYTAFTDAAYLDDYDFNDDDILVNEIYGTHLSDDYYADLRVQEYLRLGNFGDADQDQQALALPNARTEAYFNLDSNGQVRVSTSLLGVMRDADSLATYGATNYVFGNEGEKLHATVEASWQNQIITSSGLVVTPFLGIRGDAASFSGDGSPADASLFEATPIAAIDVRFPMIASNGADSHLFEPIAQMVYRGSETTLAGITNDNAHSFVLDDTNIFSYNRFTGTDRQETGLRANLGARYLANLSDGGWFEIVGGQSFHLAGVNALGIGDEVNTGVSTGLGSDASYVVLGARGSLSEGTEFGGKLQLDPSGPRVARAGFGGDIALGENLSIGSEYFYMAADTALGVPDDQHEFTVRGTAPLPADYWVANGSLSWDIAAGEWLEATGELLYDDGYFLAGAYAKATGPTHRNPDDVSFGVKLLLRGPGEQDGL